MSPGRTDYVLLSELPALQLAELRQWLPESYITREPHCSEPCIAYRDYEFWYDYCFRNNRSNATLDEQL
jgi:hypothetical protein